MKKSLAFMGILCTPLSMVLSVGAVPKVLGILLALLQLGSNIGFGTLVGAFITFVIDIGFFTAFVFLL